MCVHVCAGMCVGVIDQVTQVLSFDLELLDE